ncbi:MAG TPA: glycosyltransferase family 39 protein [Polyangiaceae bacterium]
MNGGTRGWPKLEGKAAWAALLLILVLAAAIRVWHYDYEVGRSFTYDTDTKIKHALRVAHGELAPENWKQPYFLPYAGGALLALVSWFTPLDGALAERVLTLLMIAFALGSIALTERLATRAFGERGIGLLAALLLAVAPIHVTGARYIKEDMPLVFFVQLALLQLLGVVQHGRPRDYLTAGIAAGVAIGTKFSAVLLAPMLLVAHALHVRDQRGGPRALLSVWVAVGLLCIAVGYCLVNPLVVLHLEDFARGFLYQAKYSSGAHHDGTLVSPWTHYWLFYFKRALLPGLTLIPTFAFAVALARLATEPDARRNSGALLLAAWVVLAYFAFERSTAKPFPFFARYVHPLIPALSVLAAWTLWSLPTSLRAWLAPAPARLLAATAVAGAVIWPLTHSVIITSELTQDTRLRAAEWMTAHLPRGSKIALDDGFYSPRPHKSQFDLKYFGLVSRRIYDEPVERLRRRGFHYVVLNSFRTERFRIARFDSKDAERAHQFYESVRKKCRLIQTVAPPHSLQTYGFHNPVIQIYELPRKGK